MSDIFKYNKTYFIPLLIIWIGFLSFSNSVAAKDEIYSDHGEWSFSLIVGGHSPKLTSLYNGLYQAPLLGEGELGGNVDSNDNAVEGNENQEFRFENKLPVSSTGAKAGFETQWHANKKHTLLLGIGSWEKTSIGYQSGDLVARGAVNKVVFERRAKMSYSEYYIGWQYALFSTPGFRLYIRASFNEMFDIDYREDYIFDFISGSNLATFRRIVVMEAQTAALFMGQLGVGAEKYFSKWFAIGVEAGYLKGERSVQLRDRKDKFDFAERDRLGFHNTYGDSGGGNIGYLAAESDINNPIYKKMKLSFDGWQVLLRMNIYY